VKPEEDKIETPAPQQPEPQNPPFQEKEPEETPENEPEEISEPTESVAPPDGEEQADLPADTSATEPVASDAASDSPALSEDARALFSALQADIRNIQADFQSKLKYDAHKEKIIDALHAELQAYKNGLLDKLLRPIFMDIIDVADDTRKLLKDLSAKGEEDNPERLRKIAAGLPADLEDLLYRHGVEVLVSEGEEFNPGAQKVVKTVETDDETLDKKVCERLKNGYTLDGKLIRHEIVSVWQLKKKDSNP
jgi:molecular chaperone GrpE